MPLRRSGRFRAEPPSSQHRWAVAHLPSPRAGSDGRPRPMRCRACTLCPSYAALFVPPATLFLPTPARSTQSATLFARNAARSPPRATLFVPRAVRFPPRAARRVSHVAEKVPTSTLFVPRAGHFARKPGHFAALLGLFVRRARCFAQRVSRCVRRAVRLTWSGSLRRRWPEVSDLGISDRHGPFSATATKLVDAWEFDCSGCTSSDMRCLKTGMRISAMFSPSSSTTGEARYP